MLLRTLLFVAFISLTSYIPALGAPAPKDHGHKTPHGGIVQEAEGMHAELLIEKSGLPKVYLYDSSMKPLERADLQGRLVIKVHDSSEHTKDMKASKDAKGEAVLQGDPIKGLSDWDTAVASVKFKDRWVHFRFSHPHGGKVGH